MERIQRLYDEIRFRREMEHVLSMSFEQHLNDSLSRKTVNIRTRIKKHDDYFETYRCNKKKPLKDEQCSICQYGYKSNQIVRQTCVSCYFHALCIDKWLVNSKNGTCPNCSIKLI